MEFKVKVKVKCPKVTFSDPALSKSRPCKSLNCATRFLADVSFDLKYGTTLAWVVGVFENGLLLVSMQCVGVLVNGCGLDPAEAAGKLPTHTIGGLSFIGRVFYSAPQ